MAKPYSPPTYNVPIFNPNYFQPSSSIDTTKYVASPFETRTEAFEDIILLNDNVVLGTNSSGTGNEIVVLNGDTQTFNNCVALGGATCFQDNEFSIGKQTLGVSINRLHLNGYSQGQGANYIEAIPSIFTTQSGTSTVRFEPISGLINQNPNLRQNTPSYFQNVSGRQLLVFIVATVQLIITTTAGTGSRVGAWIETPSGARYATDWTESVYDNYYAVPTTTPENSVNVSSWVLLEPLDSFVIKAFSDVTYTGGAYSKLQVICF
jgi:hypothetical protein